MCLKCNCLEMILKYNVHPAFKIVFWIQMLNKISIRTRFTVIILSNSQVRTGSLEAVRFYNSWCLLQAKISNIFYQVETQNIFKISFNNFCQKRFKNVREMTIKEQFEACCDKSVVVSSGRGSWSLSVTYWAVWQCEVVS